MWNEPTPGELARLPALYATEDVPWPAKLIHQHYFLGGSDWYMAEYSPSERVFFGFAILNNDVRNAEWGHVSLDELREVRIGQLEVDRDLHWRPRPAGEIERIVAAFGSAED